MTIAQLAGIVAMTVIGLSSTGANELTNEVWVLRGDTVALIEAVHAANRSGEPTTIRLGGIFRFGEGQRIPPITGDIEMINGPAHTPPVFRPGEEAPHQLIRVMAGGRLKLADIRIKDFWLSHIRTHDGPLIENDGELVIVQSRFENLIGITGAGFCCFHDRDPVIRNRGNLRMEHTSFLDVSAVVQGSVLENDGGNAELREVLTAARVPAFSPAIANLRGRLRITNATFGAPEPALHTEPGARTEMANTVIRPVPGQIPPEGIAEGWFVTEVQACTGPVISLGHNLAADDSCLLNGPGDVEGQPTGTFPLSLESGRWDQLVPVIGLAAASPAVDSADPRYCGQFDIRGTPRIVDGDNDGVRGCDRGAVELSQRRITEGGITGLYHVPEHDGHYLNILQNDHNVLVIWNTFDQEGNQAWIFATGELINGRSLVAEAYTNENGVLTDVGPIDIERAIPWGTVTLELESCNRGRLLFETDRPRFVSGELPFRRLAGSRQLGCSE